MAKETELTNKNMVVVGASSGLGLEVARQLSSEGSNVFALSRKIEDQQLDFKARQINCNLRKPEEIVEAFERIDQGGDLYGLINCAGIGLTKDFDATTQEEIMDVLGTNLKGSIYTSLEAYKRMKVLKSGHIVNVSSTSGLVGRDNEVVYAASKWGLRGFTESLRLEGVKHRVRVTSVCPGGMNSAFWSDFPEKDLSAFMNPEDVAGQIVHVLKAPNGISPAEVVIQRGV
jgi:short-subunit dehydrogenase